MSELLPCRFCRFAPHAWLDDYINGRAVTDPEYIIECENGNCSVMPEVRGTYPYMDEVRALWNAANALPAVQSDAALLEEACIAAHDAYEAAAHEAGWATNPQSRKPWAEVPEANKAAMRAGIGAALALIEQPAHVNETPKSEHEVGNVLTPAMNDWQPISSAPKDRVIDLWSVEGGRYPDAVWGVCGDTEGWTDANDHRSLKGGAFTHWRDRPAPPSTKGGDA